MKKKKIKEICKITHSMSNRLSVVSHLLKFYAKHLPENRMTDIGLENSKMMVEELKQLKNILNDLQQNNDQSYEEKKVIPLIQWKEDLLRLKDDLLEMGVFSIDIQAKEELPAHSIYVTPEDIKEEIGLYFEEIAMTGATEMVINIMPCDDCLKLSFSDNGDGPIDIKSENITKLKNNLSRKDISTQLRTIPGIGSNMTLSIKYINKN